MLELKTTKLKMKTTKPTRRQSNFYRWLRPVSVAAGIAGGALATQAQSNLDTFELDPFTIRGIADGQRLGIESQRASNNLLNAVSADEMGRFPDPNIAEALQRLPGIGVERDQGEGRYINIRGAPKEFSSVTFDGINLPASDVDTRAVNLDVFASDFARAIEVTKAIRPDQDADSIAGAVNVLSTSAIAIGQRRILGSAASSYNDKGGTNDSRFSLLYSDVFGESDQFGLVLGINQSKTRREVDNVEHEGWEKTTVGDGASERDLFIFAESNFKDYETRRTREGFNAALEYRPNDHNRFFLRGFTSKFEDNEFRYRLRIHWEDGDLNEDTAQNGFAEWDSPRVSFQFRERIKIDQTESLSAGGVHTFDAIEWDYTVAQSASEQYYPRRDELLYRKRVPSISYDFRDNAKLPEISLFDTNEHLDTDSYDFREYSRRTLDGEEDEFMVATNLRFNSQLFSQAATHSVGLKLRDRDKQYDFDRFRDRRGSADPGVSLTDLLRDEPARNYDYLLGRKHQPDIVQDYFDTVRPNAPQRNIDDGILSDYDVDEEIQAAYAMSNFRAGEVELVAGVRVERTRTRAAGFTFDSVSETIGTQQTSTSRTHWFPGLHAKYNVSQNLVLRSSATRGISRAPIRDLAPYREEDPDRRRLDLGNPNLNPTLADNLDLSLEYYIGNSGLVSVAGFYKDLKDYVFTARFNQDLQVDGGIFNYRVTQPLNSPDGKLQGIEFNYQQTFEFLPTPFDGLGAFVNHAITESEALLPNSSEKVDLPGQSKYTSNIGIYFERDRFSAQISYNRRSSYIQELDTIEGREFDVYWGGRTQVDMTASYQTTRNIEVFAEFNNLTNTKGLRYVGAPERVLEYEEFGAWVSFGARFNF